jgi:hypothetical protein
VRGQVNPEGRPASGRALDRDPSTLPLDERPTDREAQSYPGCADRPRGRAAVEPLVQAGELLRRDPGARIRHGHKRLPRLRGQGHADAPTRGRELHGILEEIRDDQADRAGSHLDHGGD